MGHRIIGAQRHCPTKRTNRGVKILGIDQDLAESGQGILVVRIQADGRLKLRPGLLQLACVGQHLTQQSVCRGRLRIQANRFTQIGNGCANVAGPCACHTPVDE